jgi:hypothetical protein
VGGAVSGRAVPPTPAPPFDQDHHLDQIDQLLDQETTMTEQPIPAPEALQPIAADTGTPLPPAFTGDQLQNFLTVDQILSGAWRPRRTAMICMRGDLEADYLTTLDELGEIVDAGGRPLNDDAEKALGDTPAVATALRDKAAALHTEMKANTGPILFEAMDSDAYQVFDAKHRGPDGKIKNVKAWQIELISTCAINPTMTPDQVQAVRTTIGPASLSELVAKAFDANTTGGVDVPKLPSYWHSPKPEGSSLN